MLYDRTCPECGKVFKPAHGSQVCCSEECKAGRLRRQRNASKKRNGRRLKLSPHQRMLVRLRQLDALCPKPKTEIICRNGIIIERRGTVPLGCYAAGLIRLNA